MRYAAILLLACWAGANAVLLSAGEPVEPLKLSDTFKRLKAPETGRLAVQLTRGEGFTYPLYFYIPSITADGKYLIYHRAAKGEVQLHRLTLATGESRQLTHATCEDTQWRPWCVDSGRGVLDHRSVLNVIRGLVVYFDGSDVRSVDVETLQDKHLFTLPPDREAYGQNCTTPDGNWLVYIHTPKGSIWGEPCKGAAVVAYHFDTGEQKTLCTIDSAVFHVTAYDNEHFIVTHPADHEGMMMTDMSSGRIVPLRDGDPGAEGHPIHCQVTSRGIAYEVPGARVSGLYDPLTRRRFEFPFPKPFQYIHTGLDPEGRLWFYENSSDWDKFDVHDMYALVRLDREKSNEWLRLTGTWPTYGGGQKAHFHPQLTPDRRWIMFTGGDPETETSHIFLLDVSDLKDSQGISQDLLSATGENDIASLPDSCTIDDDFCPAMPSIPDCEVRLANLSGDQNTMVFAQAIEDLHGRGGGRLIVPPGLWQTGPIHLKSGVELHLEEGAELQFSTRYADYLPVVFQQRGGVRCYNYSPFIYANDCEDVAVTGKGVLNGQGQAWWPWKNHQPGMTRLMEMGRDRTPLDQRVFGREEDGVRPDFIQFINCKRVLLEGITVKDGPSWNVHPVWCDDVTIRGVSVIAHGPNNDGIDPDGCRRVLIDNCFLDVGDDAICLKSGRDQEGWDAALPCENILIRHCRAKAGHGVLVIGSEMSAGVRNVYAHDLTGSGTDRGIRLKTRRGRGGVVENIRIENVRLEKIRSEAVMINMQYGDRSLGEGDQLEQSTSDTTPTFRNIAIRNLSCKGARQAIRLIGLPENPITGLVLEDIRAEATKPSSVQHAEGRWDPALFP